VEKLTWFPDKDPESNPTILGFRESSFGRHSLSSKAVLRLDSTQGVEPKPYHSSPTKRILDIILASILLMVFLPLLLNVAAAIKLTSRGPVIYRQIRHGEGKSRFSMYKFRSMYVSPPSATFVQAERNDPRVTFIGRWIRTTSIDELPQLLNVISGQMSLVGPRPHPIALDEQYEHQIAGYEERFLSKPGITGLAQVSGARGETPTVDHMRRRIEYDQQYVQGASLQLDLKILLATVREALFSKTAY
jgi:lipopolysaccharide/colanic/teichoic acid biosynthesis glycosyltransferase